MEIIKKEDLNYFYFWSPLSKTKKDSGDYSDVLLNLEEGYEVLDFINGFCEKYNLNRLDGIRLEEIIKYDLPKDINRQDKVSNWLKNRI